MGTRYGGKPLVVDGDDGVGPAHYADYVGLRGPAAALCGSEEPFHVTSDPAGVTCARCREALANRGVREVASGDGAAPLPPRAG